MDAAVYKNILEESTFGFTYNKIIRNNRDVPVDYIFLEVNTAYANMMGRDKAQIVGKRVTEVFSEIQNDTFNWIECFGEVETTGEKTEFEAYSEILDRWYHLSVMSPEQDHFVAISFDITEKRTAELALIVSEERNRQYIDSAPDGILILDREGRYLKANPAAANMLGYTQEELTRLSYHDLTLSCEREENDASFRRLLSNGRDSTKTVLISKGGEPVTILFESVALPEGQYMTFCKDVTQQELLIREKDHYFSAFQATSQPMVITEADGIISAVNSSFTDMYGYSREEAVGKLPRILNPGREMYYNLGYTEEEYDKLFGGLWKQVSDPGFRTWENVVINQRKDGTLVWVNLLINAVRNEKGELSSLIALPIDITLSRELEDTKRVQLYQTIADLAELRDDDTGNHMKRVGIFSRLLAKEWGMSEKFCRDIEIFAPMHDIGKVGILDSILRAPRKLTPEELAIMKTHTVLGHNIVKEKKEFVMAAEITLNHHERFDGSGYPNGLAGKNIPLSAHITSIVDVYDALRSRRPYKDPWSHEKSLAHIMESSGSQFDPELVEKFITLNPVFEKVYQKLID